MKKNEVYGVGIKIGDNNKFRNVTIAEKMNSKVGTEEENKKTIIERADDECETVAAGMLNTYLNKVEFISDMYEDYLDMFTKIKAFIM